jgi:hypothetical protein
MRAYNVLGATLLYLGAFAPARASLEQGIALDALPRDRSALARLSDHLQGDSILEVSCRRHAALTLWYLGYPEQARQRSHEAQELAHPSTLVYALYYAAILHCLRREAPAAQVQAEALMALARQHEFPDRACEAPCCGVGPWPRRGSERRGSHRCARGWIRTNQWGLGYSARMI